MMKVTDDMLMALADGELDEATSTELRTRMAHDLDLRRRYMVFSESAAMLRATFDPGPIPTRLIETIMKTPVYEESVNVVPLRRERRWLLPLAVGLAAGVVTMAIGLAGASIWQGYGGSTAIDPAQYASVPTGMEIELPDGSKLRMLGTYETDMGLCRMASVKMTDLQERRIICRDNDRWKVALRLETQAVDGFQPASDALSGMADHWLDMIAAGQALELEDETRALGVGSDPH